MSIDRVLLTTQLYIMSFQEQIMSRCIALARLGAGNVSTNPMVGAVVVHDGRIIG
jgi:diaminohydroxyphosphoribosylaminopyrimidine deaminase/5-amino-6-(5-phosphoribosylamino)uracil reductase